MTGRAIPGMQVRAPISISIHLHPSLSRNRSPHPHLSPSIISRNRSPIEETSSLFFPLVILPSRASHRINTYSQSSPTANPTSTSMHPHTILPIQRRTRRPKHPPPPRPLRFARVSRRVGDRLCVAAEDPGTTLPTVARVPIATPSLISYLSVSVAKAVGASLAGRGRTDRPIATGGRGRGARALDGDGDAVYI